MDVAFFVWTEAWMEDDVSSGGEESKDGSRRPPQHRQRNHSETTARPPALADTSLRARRLHLHDGCFQHRPMGATDILGSEQKFEASTVNCILTISHYFQAPVKL